MWPPSVVTWEIKHWNYFTCNHSIRHVIHSQHIFIASVYTPACNVKLVLLPLLAPQCSVVRDTWFVKVVCDYNLTSLNCCSKSCLLFTVHWSAWLHSLPQSNQLKSLFVCPMQFMALDRVWNQLKCESVRTSGLPIALDSDCSFSRIWNIGHTSEKEEQVGWPVTPEVLNACLGPPNVNFGRKTHLENFWPRIAYNGHSWEQTSLNRHCSSIKVVWWIDKLGSGIPNTWSFLTRYS